MSRHRRTVTAVLTGLALLASACGDSESAAEVIFRDGDDLVVSVDAALTDQIDPNDASPSEDGPGGAAESDVGDPGTTTIPLNEDDDVIGTMFQALNTFNDCLDELGTSFVGDPRTAEAGTPAADPQYLEDLSACAARSNILDAMETMQSANESMTPEDIEERNRGIISWSECMRGRGWTLDLAPDDRGMLNPTNMQGPDGEGGAAGFLDSDDMAECAAESLDAIEDGADDSGSEEEG